MTATTDFARIGNPDAPVGSPEWVLAGHRNHLIHKHNSAAEVSSLKYGLREFKRDKWWRLLTDRSGREFEHWEDYVQYQEPYGLGMSVAEAVAVIEARDDNELLKDVLAARATRTDEDDRRMLAAQPHGGDRRSENAQIKYYAGNSNVKLDPPTGNSVANAHRRLRKARPDIHARVLDGEMSAHAGMIEAGFRKPAPSRRKSALQKVRCMLPTLNEDERDALIRELPTNCQISAPLTKLRRAWKQATQEERTEFLAEINTGARQ